MFKIQTILLIRIHLLSALIFSVEKCKFPHASRKNNITHLILHTKVYIFQSRLIYILTSIKTNVPNWQFRGQINLTYFTIQTKLTLPVAFL